MSKDKLIRIVVAVAVIGLAIFGSFTRYGAAAGSTSADRGAESRTQEKTAAQEFKNVQVLKDMPASQFREVMPFFAASLGVDCSYCHVQPFDKDDKPAKLTARRMISMMQKLNAENFGGTVRVNCATCHQGHTAPITVPPLGTESTALVIDPGLTVDAVLDRYVQALGGREAIQKTTSRSSKGTLVAPNGIKVPFQTLAAPPNKTLIILETPAGVYKEGFNGSIGWVKNQNGVNEMSPTALELTKQHSDFYRNIKLKEQYTSIRLAGKTTIDSRPVYEVVGQTPSGMSETLYFDSATGLMVRWLIQVRSPFGPVPQALDFDDYRDAGGIKMPFLVKRRQSGVTAFQQYEEVHQNVPVDPAQFERPQTP